MVGRWGVAALLFAAMPASAFVRYYPVASADVMMGQYFFNGKPSSWGGNLDLKVIPAVKFNENAVLIPTFMLDYQGTKDVAELAGGAQLFQDSLKASINVKPVFQTGALRTKPYLGYTLDYLRETRDESLGKGLFDYQKLSGGLDLEYVFNPRQWASLGLEYFTLRFPNYKSLESQAGSGLGRENEGARTLDSNNQGLSASWDTDLPFPYTRATFSANSLQKDYPAQHLVDQAGQLQGGKRRDNILGYGATVSWARAVGREYEIELSAGADQLLVDSDQNHYDANAARYIPNYYSYRETALRPAVALRIPKKGALTLSYTVAQRRYADRPIQDASGGYLADRTDVTLKTLAISLAIPIAEHLQVVAQSNLSTSSSNQQYEKVFQYNYNISSHFVGVSYEY